MRCPRCHSTDLVQIGRLIYCRHCISFGQIRPTSQSQSIEVQKAKTNVHYELSYDLSMTQHQLAYQIIHLIRQQTNVYVQAVCGSGKTEIVYPVICEALAQGKKVGFSVPRKDLAIELYERLASQLKGTRIALVYGGHHDHCFETLVVCTTHQLYRFWQYFDLLIIDEADAFPFYNARLLNEMAVSACKGQFILMSATSSQINLPPNFTCVELNRRYHGHDLPLPKLRFCIDGLFPLYVTPLLRKHIAQSGLCLIFVPVKKDATLLVKRLKWLGIKAIPLTSISPNPKQILEAFRNHQIKVLVTTTLLERGVTFENVHVFVYRAHHRVFNQVTLIQIAGRVGRKPNYPLGDVYFMARRITKEMSGCLAYVRKKNAA